MTSPASSDLLGNKTGITKERRGLEKESGVYSYGYDALGRLERVSKGQILLRTYTYDAFGNRIQKTDGGQRTAYAYNTMNQLLSKTDGLGEETYTYDRRGNLSQILRNG